MNVFFSTLRHDFEQVCVCIRYNCTFHNSRVKRNIFIYGRGNRTRASIIDACVSCKNSVLLSFRRASVDVLHRVKSMSSLKLNHEFLIFVAPEHPGQGQYRKVCLQNRSYQDTNLGPPLKVSTVITAGPSTKVFISIRSESCIFLCVKITLCFLIIKNAIKYLNICNSTSGHFKLSHLRGRSLAKVLLRQRRTYMVDVWAE